MQYKVEIRSLFFAPIFFVAALLTGCAGDVVGTSGEDAAPRVAEMAEGPKLRMAHLMDRTKNNYVRAADGTYFKKGKGKGNGGGQEGGTVSLVIGTREPILDIDRFLERHRLLMRYEYENAFTGLAAEIDEARLDSFLQAIEDDPEIEWVEPDLFITPEQRDDAQQNSRDQVVPWGIARVGAPESSAQAGDGRGAVDVDLFILDTGVKEKDLTVAGSARFFPQRDGTRSSTDQNGHGTHVAGTAAAVDDAKDVVGVAPGARIHNFKVLDDHGQTEISNVIAAVDSLIAYKRAHPGTDMVANLSFGADIGTTDYNALDRAVRQALLEGIVFVVAAGNDGIDAATVTPAHVEEAITVGAYDVYQRFAWFSNHGPVVDLNAPGVDVLSLDIAPPRGKSSKLMRMTGTSMAAPHVAGAAALYLAQHPGASPAAVREALVAAARPLVYGRPEGTTNLSLWVGDW